MGQAYIKKPTFGYYSVAVMQGSLYCNATFTRMTVLEGLAYLGGLKIIT